MKIGLTKLVARLFREESGQTMILATLYLPVLVAMTGFVVDLGHAMIVNRQLQAGTDAAALAGGYYLPGTTYSTEGTDYSSKSGDDNAYANLPSGVSTTVVGYCSSWVSTNLAIPCSGASGYNAVVVTQKVNVPTYFLGLFGIPDLPVSSTAVAAERGSTPIPYNVAIIVDATASMSDTDSDSQCNTSRFACAMTGVQALLENLAPCPPSMTTCNTASTASSTYSSTASNGNSNYGAGITTPQADAVALFAFPNMKLSTISDYWGCSGADPTAVTYSFPSTTINSSSFYAGTSVGTGLTATYMVNGFTSDYKTKPSSTTLSSSSDIVKEIGAASGCTGMANPGGEGTYYAGVIYGAAAALEAQQQTYPNTQNALIIISDGQANATSTHMYNCGSGTSCYTGTAYPSVLDQCNQAVIAGQTATNAGITVYGVSYGSETGSCMTGNVAGTEAETAAQSGYTASITPCETIKGIASSTATFYSDYAQSGSGIDSTCVGTATSTTNLKDIFTDIAYNFTTSRLFTVPSGCTASAQQTANTNDTANACP
jgi:Flp pilus assembly protein TadG